jgi:serine O-acetyltransferase
VTIGSNLRYNRLASEWENVGTPIISKNVVVSDGAKILGPIIVGENSVAAAGAIVTRDVPPDSVAYGVNQFRPKDLNYDLVFNHDMIDFKKIIEANQP